MSSLRARVVAVIVSRRHTIVIRDIEQAAALRLRVLSIIDALIICCHCRRVIDTYRFILMPRRQRALTPLRHAHAGICRRRRYAMPPIIATPSYAIYLIRRIDYYAHAVRSPDRIVRAREQEYGRINIDIRI